jgi:organic radical activating enzyme
MTAKFQDFDWQFRDGSEFISNNNKNLKNIKDLLNSTGCGFCLAKFRQVTLHLGTGMTHSCHHPVPHKIPLEEIEKNPAALFNTRVLKNARKEMLANKRPSECDYCWRVEDSGENSDRFFKSLEPWAIKDHDEITSLTGDEDLYPSYLEVSFSNVCNLSCLYCGPEFSSSWVQELKQQGPVKILAESGKEDWVQGWQDLDKLNYKNREHNPYIDAFWKWFPEASKHIMHYRITGGEPLMSKETFRSLDHFIEHPNLNLELSINSNFSVPDKLWDSFIEKLHQLKQDKLKRITIYTSVEGWGDRASYARTGLDFDLLKSRVEQVLEIGNIRVVCMAAFNILSITSFETLLEWILELKKKYNPNNTIEHIEKSTGFRLLSNGSFSERKNKNPSHSSVIGIDIPYLRHPVFLDAQICSHDMVEQYLIPCLKFMSENTSNPTWTDHQGFETWEVEKLKRIVNDRIYYNKKNDPDRESHIDVVKRRYKFYDFVNTMDQRRNTNFLETFPEMKAFYDQCRESKDYYLEWKKTQRTESVSNDNSQ